MEDGLRTLSRNCFNKAWIEAESRRHRVGNTFFEKSLYAFELLGRLAEGGLDFVFKGGTSLLLRLPEPRRLSIDVDIVCRESADRLEHILKNCVGAPFKGMEEDERHHHRLPRRRHWNFHFDSINPEGSREPYIILDVLDEDCLYSDVDNIEIRTKFFTTDHSVRVRVPTVDNLLADKLTAFAPETIGQVYSADHPEKMIKHLFDIGELFNMAESLHALQDVYARIAEAEIGYRAGKYSKTDCLENTIQTARLVTALAVNRDLSTDKSSILRSGIADLRGHLIGVNFSIVDAAVAASKAALLAASIKQGLTATPLATLRYDKSKLPAIRAANSLKDPEFAKLSQVSPEAFYYWHLVEGM
jgi:Nucleotidyl transferase AbiEii toxin, Type IV TA system